MKWAFWRSETVEGGRAVAEARADRAARVADVECVDEAATLRTQARRRLIGAAVLLLVTAAVVPLVLDPLPRSLPESIPIEVRGEKTPFTPKVPLPLPDPAALQGAPPPDAASDTELAAATAAPAAGGSTQARAADGRAAVGPAAESRLDSKSSSANATAAKVAEPRPGTVGVAELKAAGDKTGSRPEAKSDNKAADSKADPAKVAKSTARADARFAVQTAAPRSEQAARELIVRLKSAGLPAYLERTEAADGPRWRVRAGPYPTRAEAERARGRLRELGLGADLVSL